MIEAIVAMAVATFVTRAVGLWGVRLQAPWVRTALDLVPAAAFAVLVAAGLDLRPGAWVRWAAVALAGGLSWRGVPVWACMIGTLALYYLAVTLTR